jgi:hypothetical protein
MSRIASVFAGLLMVSSLSGCCLLGHGNPYGGGYYGGGAGGGCGSCGNACGAMAPGYPSANLYNPAVPQTAFIQPTTANYAPQMVMTDPLGTF